MVLWPKYANKDSILKNKQKMYHYKKEIKWRKNLSICFKENSDIYLAPTVKAAQINK
jgi:hypothetical protein